ncbi:MAG: peptidoglycan DD-metalloendopeptidase family protein [Ruminococcus sp.]|nr:peptidoglycan DD-metalloendopeptidase family protein [Ruminococcus sp.]
MRIILKKAAAMLLAIAMLLLPEGLRTNGFGASAADLSATWPVPESYKNITTYFDPLRNQYNMSGYHNGIDIEAPYATPIYAVRAGTVVSADWKDAYGYMVILYHSDLGLYTFYAHCSSTAVSPGAEIAQGQQIAAVGSTGQSSGNHLHYGICNNLLSGWPDATYYDPLTYFNYNGEVAPPIIITDPECDCSEEYAGIYTTKNVTTYLNIRSGHGSTFPVVGQITPGAQVTVTKADGQWAHVECNGVKGFSSMEYLEKVSDIEKPEAGMTVTGATVPDNSLKCGESFRIRGVITSTLTIKKVWGGIYSADGTETKQYCEASPSTKTYDLSSYFDSKIIFGGLPEGNYKYKIEAEDIDGNKFVLIESDFKEVSSSAEYVKGDVNLDKEVNIADAVLLQNFLLGRTNLSEQQENCADYNSDGSVSVFDLMLIKRAAINKKE